jgi:hypothetical protein
MVSVQRIVTAWLAPGRAAVGAATAMARAAALEIATSGRRLLMAGT